MESFDHDASSRSIDDRRSRARCSRESGVGLPGAPGTPRRWRVRAPLPSAIGHVLHSSARRSDQSGPSVPMAAPTPLPPIASPSDDVGTRDRRPVGDDLERQPVQQRQDPPRGARRVRACGTRRGHARPDRPLQQALPGQVEPTRRRLERPAAGPPRPRRPARTGTTSPCRPACRCRRNSAMRLARPGRLGHRGLGQGQVLRRDALERRGQHVVHRVEVVVDQAAATCPSRPRRRGRSSRRGPS